MNRFRSFTFWSIIELYWNEWKENVNWLRSNTFVPRPLVAVEDHVYHISELLKTIQLSSSNLLSQLTVVCLDRAGPDTDAAIQDWLKECPNLQIAARLVDPAIEKDHATRVLRLSDKVFENQSTYCKTIAGLIRERGLLVQDIELESLKFIPRERWWETTMLASTVRGIVGERAPKCAFISNKRGYEATFGAELLAAGHDPRDVLNKYEMERVVVPFFARHLHESFPLQLVACENADDQLRCRVNSEDVERNQIHSELDLVLWPEKNQSIELGGKSLADNKKPFLSFPASGNEAFTWSELIRGRLEISQGIEVQSVGQRVAPAGALRAEATNAAARHIHALRKRLADPQHIVTVQGHYRFADELKIAQVTAVNP
jgi:hypothetical protein